MLFADPWGTADNLPLRDRVHGINVIHPFFALPIALVDRIHPQVSGSALWVRPTPLPDGDARRGRPGEFGGTLPVPGTVAQCRFKGWQLGVY
jgi:hypothetical protein